MHLQQAPLLSMTDGGGFSSSLAGHLVRSPGGSLGVGVGGGNPSRLHSIEAILGFTKEDTLLGAFPGPEGGGGGRPGKEAEKISPRDGYGKLPGEQQQLPGSAGPDPEGPAAEHFEGERQEERRGGPRREGGQCRDILAPPLPIPRRRSRRPTEGAPRVASLFRAPDIFWKRRA